MYEERAREDVDDCRTLAEREQDRGKCCERSIDEHQDSQLGKVGENEHEGDYSNGQRHRGDELRKEGLP